MNVNTENKRLVKEFYDEFNHATPDTIEALARKYYTEDTILDGSHPINHLEGLHEIVEKLWKPMLTSFPDLLKVPYIFMGGQSVHADEAPSFRGAHWVCSTGYYEATFRQDFMDIPANGKMVFLRYCEYSRVENSKIVLTRTMFDFLDLMRQVGIVFFNALGNENHIPGPRTFDGILMGEYPEEISSASVKLIESMLFDGMNAYKEKGWEAMGEERFFQEDFSWYGPGSIGICKGLTGFQEHHQKPWLHSFPDRQNGNFFASIGENNYASVGGWPAMVATHTGSDWLGIPATGKHIDMRCIDWWRVENGKIVENWVNLDVPHMLLQMGIDIFGRLRSKRYFFCR